MLMITATFVGSIVSDTTAPTTVLHHGVYMLIFVKIFHITNDFSGHFATVSDGRAPMYEMLGNKKSLHDTFRVRDPKNRLADVTARYAA